MSFATLWLLLAIIAAIAEIVSPLFGYFFVTAAALVAALAASLHLSVSIQIGLFAATLVLALLLLRPRLLAKLAAKGVPSRTEALIGKVGLITEPIDPVVGTGRITVAGEDWAAQSDKPLPAGTPVRVRAADGLVLQVSPE